MLLLLGFYSSDLLAQVPQIDGDPSEWPGILNNTANTKKGFKHDPFNVNGVDDQWTGGSSDADASPASNWHWVKGNSNDKGDIGNAGAVLLNGKLYFFGDRSSESGDAQIGFWFFKNNVQPTGTGDRSSPFIGEHSNGDLLIISNFTNGGGHAKPTVYEWLGKTATSPGSPQIVTGALADLTTNSSLQDAPGGATGTTMYNGEKWIFAPKSGTAGTYPAPLFFEGYVDLTSIPGLSQCFQRFLLETRNSQSISASLQDLASNSFTSTVNVTVDALSAANTAGPVALASVPPHYYLSSLVDGQANNSAYTYSWVQDPPTGGSLSATNIPNPSFTATAAGTFTWTLTATEKVPAGTQGCVNNSSVTRVIFAPAGCPNVPVAPVCAGTTNLYTADAGPAANETWIWSVNNGATINSSPANGGQSISVTAGTQNFTLTLTKKYANTALADQVCTYNITINPPAPAPDVTYIPPTCTQNTFSVKVNSPVVGSTYTLTQLDNNTVSQTYSSGELVFTGLHIGQGYSVSSITSAGCKSTFNDCGTFTHTTARIARAIPKVDQQVEQATVIAAPNPFNDRIRFSIKSPMSGKGSLDLYNMLGQKVRNVYQGSFEKGMVQYFEYNVPLAQRSNLIYLFTIGNQKVSGKLINLK
jgi:hypothetical protein